MFSKEIINESEVLMVKQHKDEQIARLYIYALQVLFASQLEACFVWKNPYRREKREISGLKMSLGYRKL